MVDQRTAPPLAEHIIDIAKNQDMVACRDDLSDRAGQSAETGVEQGNIVVSRSPSGSSKSRRVIDFARGKQVRDSMLPGSEHADPEMAERGDMAWRV